MTDVEINRSRMVSLRLILMESLDIFDNTVSAKAQMSEASRLSIIINSGSVRSNVIFLWIKRTVPPNISVTRIPT